MRINSIDVRAYGPFTNKQFDFSRGHGKLELIYGPNEAGKSSLLRTLSDLLFGIPTQTRDAFLHPYPSLLIGAAIEHEGKSLDVLRRKGTGNTLRSADEKSPVTEMEFRAVVPIDNRVIFETMFGIDAIRLAEGGRELMIGKGDFGKLLFSAASGIEDFRGILAALTADAEALFKGRTGAIAKRVEECKDLKKRINEVLLSTNALAELTERRQQAAANLERLGEELHAKTVDGNRLERLREALDLLAQRQVRLAGLETLRLVRVARGGYADEFSRTEEGLRQKQLDSQRMVQEIAALEREIEVLVYSEALLRHEGEIAKLPERVGAERKAAADKVKLQSQELAAERKADASFAELGIAAHMEAIPALRIMAESRRKAEELDSQFSALNADRKSAARDVAKLRREIEINGEMLAALAEARPIATLQQALNATGQFAALAFEYAARRVRAGDEEKNLAAALSALPWEGSLESLMSADLPAALLVETWKQRMRDVEARIESARGQSDEAEEHVFQCEAAIRQQEAGRPIPTREAMESARHYRDRGWQAVRKAWLEGDINCNDARDFLSGDSSPERLAEAFQKSVASADSASDLLREHANEAARFVQALADLKNAAVRRDGRAAALEKLRAEFADLQLQWAELWRPWKLEAHPPSQMSEWLIRRGRLMDRGTQLASLKESIRIHDLQADVAVASLKDAMRAVGEATDDWSLAALRVLAGNFIERQQANQTNRAALETALADGRKKLEAAVQHAAEVDGALSEWAAQWKGLLEQLRMSPGLEPAVVRATLELRRQLTESYKDWNEKRQRIAAIDTDARQFKELVERLTEQVADDLSTLEPSAAADQLHQRLKEHVRNRDLRAEKERTLAKLKSDLRQADENLDAIRTRLDALVAEAGCTAASQIGEYIKLSNQRAALEVELPGIEARLTQIAGIGGIEALEKEALQHSVDELPAEIEDLRRALKQLGAERDEALRAETTLNNDLAALEGRNDAAAAASDLESARANLVDEAERYVRLKLAEHVLKSAVESYRKKASGEMLQRSSAIFSALTLGSFDGLDLDWGEKNNPELVGVRNGSAARVKTDQMSSGTCDQLYLALRVASLEIYFRNHPPVPFIADDVLIHFDDERAAAALRILAGLAQHTQVLLFTHHEHLLHVATSGLEPKQLAVYRIESTS
jgi:uncharacterized protein YhaN